MKRGFTIIELLVASALLGMLVTILTMIFNQSSIAWRVGVQGVADLSTVRSKFGIFKEQLDNVVILPSSQNGVYQLVNLWGPDNQLRNRAIKVNGLTHPDSVAIPLSVNKGDVVGKELKSTPRTMGVGSGNSAGGAVDTYIVNVKSGGPHNDITRYDAIWSTPDDTSDW